MTFLEMLHDARKLKEAEKVMNELYELGRGSHTTYKNVKIELTSWWGGTFAVDGKSLNWSDAKQYIAFEL